MTPSRSSMINFVGEGICNHSLSHHAPFRQRNAYQELADLDRRPVQVPHRRRAIAVSPEQVLATIAIEVTHPVDVPARAGSNVAREPSGVTTARMHVPDHHLTRARLEPYDVLDPVTVHIGEASDLIRKVDVAVRHRLIDRRIALHEPHHHLTG